MSSIIGKSGKKEQELYIYLFFRFFSIINKQNGIRKIKFHFKD